MAMIGISAIGFLLSDGEKRRVRWIRAMRRCLLRMNGIIRYEQPELPALLERIDLRATPQERELTRRRMEKRPGRIKTACLLLTVEMILMFMVPLVMMIVGTLTEVGF